MKFRLFGGLTVVTACAAGTLPWILTGMPHGFWAVVGCVAWALLCSALLLIGTFCVFARHEKFSPPVVPETVPAEWVAEYERGEP